MDLSNLKWSKQLRRENSSPTKHTIGSLQKDCRFTEHFMSSMIAATRKRYQRPPRLSELAKEVELLKRESLEKLNLENESQKTFESMQKQIDLLRSCFESFTSMIVEECEDLRRDHLKSLEDVSKVDQKYVDSADSISRDASLKCMNLQTQIDELRNVLLLQQSSSEECKCTQCTHNEKYSAFQMPEYRRSREDDREAIAALTRTVAKQQQIIDELRRKIERRIPDSNPDETYPDNDDIN